MAELYYLQRKIDCFTNFWDAERSIRFIEELIEAQMKD